MSSVPPVAFIGIAERSALVRMGNTTLHRYNILGLSHILVSHIVPIGLAASSLAFAFYEPAHDAAFKVRLTHDSGKQVGEFDIRLAHASSAGGVDDDDAVAESAPPDTPRAITNPAIPLQGAGWTFAIMPAGTTAFLLTHPGDYTLSLASHGDAVLGRISLVLVEPPPLTPARVAGIRSDPTAVKALRLQVQCNTCQDVCRIYTGLERSSTDEAEGWQWSDTLPDNFRCSCGAVDVELGTIKRNIHGLLGTRGGVTGSIAFVPMYEQGAIQHVRTNFALLLSEDAPEETFQRFIEDNPVILYPFTPERIFFKSPILSLHKTDFAIVNHQRELILVELEKPKTRILKRDGGIHSELQHAFDQTRDWLHASDEHRAAVLECIGVERGQVGAVRTVVVAGRDAGYDKEHLRKLKGADYGRTKFLTYDDLLAGLDALLRTVETM